MKTDRPVKIGRLRRALLRGTVQQRAKIMAALFSALMLFGFLVPLILTDGSAKLYKLVIVVLIGNVTGGLSGLLFYALIKRPLQAADQKRAEMLGRRPAPSEIEALYFWYKFGIKPTRKVTQSLLPGYLDYLEIRMKGMYTDSYTRSKRYRYWTILFACFWLASGIVRVFGPDPNVFLIVCNFVAGLAMLTAFFQNSQPNPRPSRLATRLNAKRLRKIATMRQQLKA